MISILFVILQVVNTKECTIGCVDFIRFLDMFINLQFGADVFGSYPALCFITYALIFLA